MSQAVEQGATLRLASWVVGTTLQDIPALVQHEGLRAWLNFLGCAVGGVDQETRRTFERSLAGTAGRGSSTVFGCGRSSDCVHAALANALAATVYGFCDTHAQAIVHPSPPALAAALALGEQRKAHGRDLLLAGILGLEVACRLSKAISVHPAVGNLGWLQSGLVGGVGAVVACGKLLGLDVGQLASAIGLAAAQGQGLRVAMGTMSTPLIHAQGADTGLRAALLAAEGFTGPQNGIEGEYGFARMFAPSAFLDGLTDRLGKAYELSALTYKPFPAGIVAHPAIDAALRLYRRGLDAANIVRVDAVISPAAAKLTARRHPADSTDAQFSLQHWSAVALIHGTARVQDADPPRLQEPAVVALREKIHVRADERITADAADMSITLQDGRQLRESVEHCVGSIAHPMGDADIENKVRGLCEPVMGAARCTALIGETWALRDMLDVSCLGAICR